MSAVPAAPLPRPVKRAAIALLVLSIIGAVGSMTELLSLSALEEQTSPTFSLTSNPGLQRQIEVQFTATRRALLGMQTSRSAILLSQALACLLVFVLASRLLRPYDIPRDRVRRFLGWAALGVAVLRTLDGAQRAVVARRVGEATGEVLLDPELTGLPWGSLMVTASVVQTTAIAGAYLLLSMYFRSEKVRQAIEPA